MWTVALIVFRETLEAIMVIGILLGINKQLHLHQEGQVKKGALFGFVSISILIVVIFRLFSTNIRFPEEQFEAGEHLLLMLSGIFLISSTLLIHPIISEKKRKHLDTLVKTQSIGNISITLLSFSLVVLEGVEIILFTISSSYMRYPYEYITGLIIGFTFSILVGILMYKSYLRIHMQKMFKITEYALIGFGCFLILKGGGELLSAQFFH